MTLPVENNTVIKPASPAPKGWFDRHLGLRFAALFLTLFTLASLAWSGAKGTAFERLIIERATVATSARLISWLKPDEGIRAQGPRLVSPRARLTVLNGCDGTETVILFASAILAFPASWRRKLAGLFVAASGAFVFNQIRLAALYFTLRHQPAWFEAVHGYIAPALIIVLGSLLFLAWVRYADDKTDVHAVSA